MNIYFQGVLFIPAPGYPEGGSWAAVAPTPQVGRTLLEISDIFQRVIQ